MRIKAIDNTPQLQDVFVRGKKLDDDLIGRIFSADLEMSTTEISELTFTIDDPDFRTLDKGIFDPKTPVTYRGLHLYVAVIETNDGGGLGGLTVRCRPLAVKKLKELQGKRVAKDITPGAYVISECKLAKVAQTPLVQQLKKKNKIARDKKESGVDYDPASEPSAWTTIQRLASEEGAILYEVGGRIYFAKPTWLVEKLPKLEIGWYPEDGTEPYTIPQFRQSVDSKDVEITMELPISRAGNVIPGMGLSLTDFPRFDGSYYVTGVSYPLTGIGRGNVVINAATVRNPEKQQSVSLGSMDNYTGEWVPNADKKGNNCSFTPKEMVNRALNRVGNVAYSGHCQAFIDVLGKGHTGGADTAMSTWEQKPASTPHGSEANAPAGAVVLWNRQVGDGAGHIAMSIGDGMMVSTKGSTSSPAAIDKCRIDGYIDMANYVGWMYPDLVGPP